MPRGNHAPSWPIGRVVEELSTEYPDVSHSSLRFLEREQLVEPDRTAGGHRLYTPDHIARIRQIKEWQRERLSLDEIRERLARADALGSPNDLAKRFLEQAIGGDLAAARETILTADELGMPLVTIFDEVLRPALYDLGDRWASGDLSVGQEKEVSALTRDLIAELSLRHAAEEMDRGVVVAACGPGEYHELGLRMVVGVLEAQGYVVYYLGPDVAPEFLVERIRQRQPSVILLAATRREALPGLRQALDTLQKELPDERLPVIIVGGQAVQQERHDFGQPGVTIAAGDSIRSALDAALSHLSG